MPNTELFESERMIVRSIGQRAVAFGSAHAAGMSAHASKDATGVTRIAFMFGDSGIVVDAWQAVRILAAADGWHGTVGIC